jgi:hypothetical protein
VRPDSDAVLIVAEALHPSARNDVGKLTEVLATEIRRLWSAPASGAVLSEASPQFNF